MSHHGKELEELSEQFAELSQFQKKISGEYPDGKLTPTDEGGLAMKVTTFDDKVVLAFGEPTAWVGMTGDQAAQLGADLIKRAKEAGRKEPLPITL